MRGPCDVPLTKDEIAGPLRIVGPRTTFQPIIWQLIEEFCQRYPAIQPDVLLEDRVDNSVEDRVDVGFRLGSSPHERVIARPLFPLQLIICATPEYVAKAGVPATPVALASHRCAVFRHPGTGKVAPWHIRIENNLAGAPDEGGRCGIGTLGAAHA